MTDFVSLGIQETPYAMSNYLSYQKSAPQYQAYLLNLSSITEPKTYKEAISNPRWI